MHLRSPSLEGEGQQSSCPQMHPPPGRAHLVHVQLQLEHAIGVEVDFSVAPVSHSCWFDGAPALPAAQMPLRVVCWNQQKVSSGWVQGMDFAQCVNSHSVVNWEEDHSSEMPRQCQRFGLWISGSSAQCKTLGDALGPPDTAICCLGRDFTVASQRR